MKIIIDSLHRIISFVLAKEKPVVILCDKDIKTVFSVTISAKKLCSVRLYLQLFVGGLMFYLSYLCLFAHSGVQHILCSVFVLFVFVLCLVYPMLPVSLECPFLIAPLVLSNVYLPP